MHPITQISPQPTTHLTNTRINPCNIKQHTTTGQLGLREFNQRQRSTHHQSTYPINHAFNHPSIPPPTHPTNQPSHQYTHSSTQHQNNTQPQPNRASRNLNHARGPPTTKTHIQLTMPSIAQPSTHPTDQPSHQYTHSFTQHQNTQLQANRAYGNLNHARGPRTTNIHIQLTMHSSIHPPTLPITISPIHPFIHATLKQHTTTEKPCSFHPFIAFNL